MPEVSSEESEAANSNRCLGPSPRASSRQRTNTSLCAPPPRSTAPPWRKLSWRAKPPPGLSGQKVVRVQMQVVQRRREGATAARRCWKLASTGSHGSPPQQALLVFTELESPAGLFILMSVAGQSQLVTAMTEEPKEGRSVDGRAA